MTIDDLRADVEAAVFSLEHQPRADELPCGAEVGLVRAGRVRELDARALLRTLRNLYPMLGWPLHELERYGRIRPT